jgi:type II secretory pathway pseudopilin PulG
MTKAFTLIEVVIYIAIVSVVLFFLLMSSLNLINYQEKVFYFTQLNKEINFISRKFLFYLNGSSDLAIITSSNSTEVKIFYYSTSTSIILQNGSFYLKKNILVPLTSSHFDFSSTTFAILTGQKKGIQIFFRGNVKEQPKLKSELELNFFIKNE